MSLQAKADWIAVDWGTTNLRAWALDSQDNIIAHRSSSKGMSSLEKDEFEPTLLELIGDLIRPAGKTAVVICGMAGSRQGWAEAPYKTTPCAPPALKDATTVRSLDERLDVRILPGIKQPDPADVMRGEETQIAGFLSENAGFSGTLCLPGTHSKWVRLQDGIVEHFRTCMTGEMFALLSARSVLQHSLSPKEMDQTAFDEAVEQVAGRPQSIATSLFGIRAGGLVAGLSPQSARGRLSGLLIGAELAAVRDEFDLSAVILLGSDQIATAYQRALARLGHKSEVINAEATTLNGLALAYSSYSKVSS
ncbi:2-dehydro-3-deoxygalactonokinase [uncultured Roseibium sp.]|uniref:2-dehydro-3-deoxygalactonokinase n=1 Tax=uncultured Roseibium sp. TaxID=1936171 RepID=UPI0026109522|nr:2-dehydro-3-deoxygalactonokinase [uncultured Roseibium sp.]